MDWDKLRIFHAVADAGSLTHAGDTLHLSQSAVSRQIRALEEALEHHAVPPPRTRADSHRTGRASVRRDQAR
jgi:molybdenum-dependent DNA-binding transcriptional regulator ModE